MTPTSGRKAGAVRKLPLPERVALSVPRYRQPDDVTCGPTCLLSVLHFYGDRRGFPDLLGGIDRNPDGGTLAVYLALAALRLGYRATIHPYNLRIFDPTWFELPREAVAEKLRARAALAAKKKVRRAAEAYAAYLGLGGELVFGELYESVITGMLARGHPILCGLSSTWLYRQSRENQETNADDDVGGEATGHFVVICGYEERGRHFLVSDPSPHAPFGTSGLYTVEARRLLNSILLGELTYDAVLLEIHPREASS